MNPTPNYYLYYYVNNEFSLGQNGLVYYTFPTNLYGNINNIVQMNQNNSSINHEQNPQ